jgi:hypothetical protein
MNRTVRYLRFAILGKVEHPRRPRQRPVVRGPVRDWKFRAWIRSLPCAACKCMRFVEAAHTGIDGGMGQKAGDRSCVPLCAPCHRTDPGSYHQIGREQFAAEWNLDFEKLVQRLNEEWEREQ